MLAKLSRSFSVHTDQVLQCSCVTNKGVFLSSTTSFMYKQSMEITGTCLFVSHRRLCGCVPVDVRCCAHADLAPVSVKQMGVARAVSVLLFWSWGSHLPEHSWNIWIFNLQLCVSQRVSLFFNPFTDSLGPRLLAWSVQ